MDLVIALYILLLVLLGVLLRQNRVLQQRLATASGFECTAAQSGQAVG